MIIPDDENLTFLFENFNIDDKGGNESETTPSTSKKNVSETQVTKNDLTTDKNVETITEKGPIPTYNRKIILPYPKPLTFENKFSNTSVNNISVNSSNLNITSHVNIQNNDNSNSVHIKPNYDDIDQEVIKEIVYEHEKIADQMVKDQEGVYNVCNLMFSKKDYSLNELNQTLSDLEDHSILFSTSLNNKKCLTELNELTEPESSVDTSSPSTSISCDSFDINYLDNARSIFDEESVVFINKEKCLDKLNENLINLDVDNSCSTFSSKDDDFTPMLNELTEPEKSPYTPSTSPSNDSSGINYSEIIQCKVHHSRKSFHIESKFGKSEINNNVQTYKFEKCRQMIHTSSKQENNFSVLIPNLPIFNPVPSKTLLESKMCNDKKKQIWIHISNMNVSELTKISNNETFLVRLLKNQTDYKLEKIFAVVERLKSEKCLKVLSKDHEKGLLYNAIVYCSNEPLIARYIAESLADVDININEVCEGKTLMEFIKMKHGDKYNMVCNEFSHLIKN